MPETKTVAAGAVCAEERAPRRILFVCTGNTCRSPMAAAMLNTLSRPAEGSSATDVREQPAYLAESAGLYADEGAPISAHAAEALALAGVPLSEYVAHRARNVTREMVDAADEVVGLTAAHAMELLLRFPEAASKLCTLPMDIADPYGGDLERYTACLLQLRQALELAYFFGGEQ